MGRYIEGDIEHKLWFGVQPSDAASQFGGELEPSTIPYHYPDMDSFDIDTLLELLDELKRDFDLDVTLDTDPDFFYKDDVYKLFGNSSIGADAQLGLKIYQCILKNGECSFDAEY